MQACAGLWTVVIPSRDDGHGGAAEVLCGPFNFPGERSQCRDSACCQRLSECIVCNMVHSVVFNVSKSSNINFSVKLIHKKL